MLPLNSGSPTDLPEPVEEKARREPTRASLRQLLHVAMRTDPELDSFCIDHCREVFELFTAGMTRTAKFNLLLQYEEPATLLAKLCSFKPALLAQSKLSAPATPGDGTSGLLDAIAVPHAGSSGTASQGEATASSLSTPSIMRGQIRGEDEQVRLAHGWFIAGLFVLGAMAGGSLLWAVGYGPLRELFTPSSAPPARAEPATVGSKPHAPVDLQEPMAQIPGGWLRRRDRAKPAGGLAEVPDTLLRDFEIDVREVTVGSYIDCVKASMCVRPHASPSASLDSDDAAAQKLSSLCNGLDPQRIQHPVNCVDFAQAESYCAWRGKRLPTEDEWLFAARGSTPERLSLGQRNPNTPAPQCLRSGVPILHETARH